MQRVIKYLVLTVSISIIQTGFNVCIAQQNNSKDTSIITYYDSQLKVLNDIDSSKASYYRIVKYRDGKILGAVNDYYRNGKPLMTGYYNGNIISDEFKQGQFTWYYENGEIFQTCAYISGLLQGPYIEFYPSGAKKIFVNYMDGKRYGCEFSWSEDGLITHHAFAVDDSLYSNIDCDTNFSIQKEVSVDTLLVTNQQNTYTKSKDKNCEKNNTGDYCFMNSTGIPVSVALYIAKEGTGDYFQVDRFANVSVSWKSEKIIPPGQTLCFYNIVATDIGCRIMEPDTFSNSKINANESFLVEKCKSRTFVIKYNDEID